MLRFTTLCRFGVTYHYNQIIVYHSLNCVSLPSLILLLRVKDLVENSHSTNILNFVFLQHSVVNCNALLD